MKNTKLLQLLSEENDIISVMKLERILSNCHIDLPDFEFQKTKCQNWM